MKVHGIDGGNEDKTLTHSSCLSHLNPDPEEPPPALRGRLHRRPRLEDYNN